MRAIATLVVIIGLFSTPVAFGDSGGSDVTIPVVPPKTDGTLYFFISMSLGSCESVLLSKDKEMQRRRSASAKEYTTLAFAVYMANKYDPEFRRGISKEGYTRLIGRYKNGYRICNLGDVVDLKNPLDVKKFFEPTEIPDSVVNAGAAMGGFHAWLSKNTLLRKTFYESESELFMQMILGPE